MTQLYLIRHGEAMSAVENRIGNSELSPLGVRQAERLRERLAATGEIAADVLISSTMLRAQQTAEIIAPALGLPIIFDDEVQELRPGEAEGMSIEEYRKTFGSVDFEKTPFKAMAPGAENWGQFMLRVCTALDRITREHEGKIIVIVCHGGVIDGSFLYFFQMVHLNLPPVFYFDTHNTSITAWRTSQRANRWRLVKYNDVMHLHDLDSPVPIPWHELSTWPIQGADQPTVPVKTEE